VLLDSAKGKKTERNVRTFRLDIDVCSLCVNRLGKGESASITKQNEALRTVKGGKFDPW